MAILFLVAVFGLMYFLLIRPQQKRLREQQALVRDTEVGDEVMTSSGIYGIVTELEDDTLLIEVAEGIEMRMARGAVARILTKGAGTTPQPGRPEKPVEKDKKVDKVDKVEKDEKIDEPSDTDDANDNS
ncbi:MAG TPA: preprotein translocase subunit YajC [Acidimicrobiales bacterium]|nr:preprotein translocase subunit YajC [Acidimicrobiales bacterium]